MARVAHDITPPAQLYNTAAWWLRPLQAPAEAWRQRCVERITFSSRDDTRVRITGQIKLPKATEASLEFSPTERLYLVPYFWLGKDQPRTSPYELRDVHGEPIPAYTRSKNAEITKAAFERFAQQHLHASRGLLRDRDCLRPAFEPVGDADSQITFASLLLRLIVGGRTQAVLSQRLILEQLAMENENDLTPDGRLPGGKDLRSKQGIRREDLRRFELLLRDIAASELLWVPLVGEPLSDFQLELTYNTKADKLSAIRHRARKREVMLVEAVHSDAATEARPSVVIARESIKEDDRRDRTTVRRIWNRLAHLFGYAPYETLFGASAMHRWSSYHLYVDAPPGLEIRGTQLLTRLEWPNEQRGHVRTEISTERAHLMVSQAQFTRQAAGREPVPVRIRMRAGDHHVTWVAAGTTVLVALMLLAFAKTGSRQLSQNTSAISEILVIVPALLLTFAVRPGEHGLASRVLGGVRALVLLSGACCVAAAVVLARSTWSSRDGWSSDVGGLLTWDATFASLIAALLLLSVVLSFRWLDKARLWLDRRFDDARLKERNRRLAHLHPGDTSEKPVRPGSWRYRNVAAVLLLLQVGLAFWVGLEPRRGLPQQHLAELVVAGIFGPLLVCCSAILAARGEYTRTSPPGAAGVLGCTAIVMALLVLPALGEVSYTGLLGTAHKFAGAFLLALPFAVVMLSRLLGSERHGHQPGYDYLLSSAEGDHYETVEMKELVDALVEAIVTRPGVTKKPFYRRYNPWASTDRAVVADLSPTSEERTWAKESPGSPRPRATLHTDDVDMLIELARALADGVVGVVAELQLAGIYNEHIHSWNPIVAVELLANAEELVTLASCGEQAALEELARVVSVLADLRMAAAKEQPRAHRNDKPFPRRRYIADRRDAT